MREKNNIRKIQNEIMLSPTARVHKKVIIGAGTSIGEYTIVGYPPHREQKVKETRIGRNCVIGSHVVIYDGTFIGNNTYIEDFSRIGQDVIIGNDCRILYGAKIYDETVIGNNCIIGGFISERVQIGNNVRIFGEIIHFHREPHRDWDSTIEESPTIKDNVFIGFGAKIIGGITIGQNSYITAGAIVTKDVPPYSIVSSINKIVHYTKWKGKLRTSKFFQI